MQWDQCRRFYNFLMADNMKKIILSHRYCSTSFTLTVLIGSIAVLDSWKIMHQFIAWWSLNELTEKGSPCQSLSYTVKHTNKLW